MNGGCIERSGCGGSLCRSCRTALQRFEILRYPHDSTGQPLLDESPREGVVCGLLAVQKGKSSADTLGRPGRSERSLTVAACELGRVRVGDRVVIKDRTWRVVTVYDGAPQTAKLLPEWEEVMQWS